MYYRSHNYFPLLWVYLTINNYKLGSSRRTNHSRIKCLQPYGQTKQKRSNIDQIMGPVLLTFFFHPTSAALYKQREASLTGRKRVAQLLLTSQIIVLLSAQGMTMWCSGRHWCTPRNVKNWGDRWEKLIRHCGHDMTYDMIQKCMWSWQSISWIWLRLICQKTYWVWVWNWS